MQSGIGLLALIVGGEEAGGRGGGGGMQGKWRLGGGGRGFSGGMQKQRGNQRGEGWAGGAASAQGEGRKTPQEGQITWVVSLSRKWGLKRLGPGAVRAMQQCCKEKLRQWGLEKGWRRGGVTVRAW